MGIDRATLLYFLCVVPTIAERDLRYWIYTKPDARLINSTSNTITIEVYGNYVGYVSTNDALGFVSQPPPELAIQYQEENTRAWRNDWNYCYDSSIVNNITIGNLKAAMRYKFRFIGLYSCTDRYDLPIDNNNIPMTDFFSTDYERTDFTYSEEENSIYLNWQIRFPDHAEGDLKIIWEYEYIACKENIIGTGCKILRIDRNDFEIGDKIPYAKYNISILPTGSLSFSARRLSFNSSAKGEIGSEEVPTLKEFDSNETSISLTFSRINCTRLNGPIFINYFTTSTNENCLNSIEKSISRQQLLPNGTLVIMRGLSPACKYRIIVLVSRKPDYWHDRKEIPNLPEISTRSKLPGVVLRVKELTVTSQGSNLISLRWLPTSSFIKEYSVKFIYASGSSSDITIFSNKSFIRCKLWPKYHCYDHLFKNEENVVQIGVVALAEYNGRIDINEIIRKMEYVHVSMTEGVPEPPINVTTRWMDSILNVYWNHPNRTNGIVKRFQIDITLTYENSKMDVQPSYLVINGTHEYKMQYNFPVTIPANCNKSIQHIALCVFTKNSKFESNCQPSQNIQPAPPKEYNKQLEMSQQIVIVSPPDIDDFFSEFYVFLSPKPRSPEEFKKEINELISSLTNGENIYSKPNNELICELRRDRLEKVQIVLPKGSPQYEITMLVVNELDQKRSVSTITKTIITYENTNTTQSLGIIIFGVISSILLIFAIIYLCVRFRTKLKELEEGIVIYSNFDDTAPLTYHANIHKPKEGVENSPNETSTVHSKKVKIEALNDYIKSAIETFELHKQHQLFPRADDLMRNDTRFTCNYGNLPQNQAKNRYNNAIGYDHTLVKLKQKIPGIYCSDYINANYIDGYKMPRAYIATQGPKSNTILDFWRMIWENHVKFVVMLTNLYDGDKKKCEKYWPENHELLDLNGISIKCVKIKTYRTYTVRKFDLTIGEEKRTVYQIHFTAWPPLGQPLFPQTLVPLLQKMMTLPCQTNVPILVHCSAGIGRTGTIIMCDICLRMASIEGAVDVLGTLEKIRKQRPNMVDNVEQYKLAHLVILATLTAWNTRIPCDGCFQSNVESVLSTKLVSQMNYIKESEWQDDAMKTVATAVQKHISIVPNKNRYTDILPDELCQVFLEQLPGKDSSSCYINAIWVDSYLSRNRYIVTQHPLANTVDDFWRLVVQKGCGAIVNLNPLDEIDTQTTLKVQLMTYNDWPTEKATPESIETFVSFVTDVASIMKLAEPIIVTCHDGASASGMFVALSNVIEQMQNEQICDVCEIIRSLRVRRKQFIGQDIQLEFLYNAISYYAKNIGTYMEINPHRNSSMS